MSRFEKDLERIIDQLNIDPEPNPEHRQELRRKMLSAFETAGSSPTKEPQKIFPKRRFRMNRLAKIAASILIVAAIVAGIVLFTQTNGTATIAWAELSQAIDNSKAAEWVHFRAILAGKQAEGWISMQPFRQFVRESDSIQYIDGQTAQRFYYDVSSRTLTVQLIPELRSEPFVTAIKKKSFLEVALAGLEHLKEDQQIQMTRDQQEIDGKTYTVLYVTYEKDGTRTRIKIDTELSQIVSITGQDSVTRETTTINLDYPENGPEDIYALGVPQDAKIIDDSKPIEREESEWDRQFKKAIEAIERRAEWATTPEEVSELYWQARAAKNYDEMAVLWPASALWNHELKDEKPVKYVFGKAYESPEAPEYMLVPYAAEGYYKQHGAYNLKMILTNKASTKGRYYIISGN